MKRTEDEMLAYVEQIRLWNEDVSIRHAEHRAEGDTWDEQGIYEYLQDWGGRTVATLIHKKCGGALAAVVALDVNGSRMLALQDRNAFRRELEGRPASDRIVNGCPCPSTDSYKINVSGLRPTEVQATVGDILARIPTTHPRSPVNIRVS
jgi:hypothetical protein